MSIYKKNPSGQEEEISSIYRKNPDTGEVNEITSIYKGGELIYTVTKPLWKTNTFQYILEKPQLSYDKTSLSHNFNTDKNVATGEVSGLNTIYTGQNIYGTKNYAIMYNNVRDITATDDGSGNNYPSELEFGIYPKIWGKDVTISYTATISGFTGIGKDTSSSFAYVDLKMDTPLGNDWSSRGSTGPITKDGVYPVVWHGNIGQLKGNQSFGHFRTNLNSGAVITISDIMIETGNVKHDYVPNSFLVLGGTSQAFYPNPYNFIGNRYISKDNKTIYALSQDSSKNVVLTELSLDGKNVPTVKTSNALTAVSNVLNVYNTGWTQFSTSDVSSGVKTVKTPLLLYFAPTANSYVAGMASPDGFVEKGDFPKANGSLVSPLGNPNIIPVDKFKLARDSSDYGKLNGVHGGVIGIIGDSSKSSNIGNAIYLTNGAKGIASNLDNSTTNLDTVKITFDVNMGSDSYSGLNGVLNPGVDIPIYIDASKLTPLGYYSIPGTVAGYTEEHYSFAMPVSLDKSFPTTLDGISNNIAIVDIVHFISSTISSVGLPGPDLWGIGVITNDTSFIKKELGKVRAIAEDYTNYDKELVVPDTGIGVKNATSNFGSVQMDSKYITPTKGAIYASISDTTTNKNQVKKFRLNGKDTNYWDASAETVTRTSVDPDGTGTIVDDSRYTTSDLIKIPKGANNVDIIVRYKGAIISSSAYICIYDNTGKALDTLEISFSILINHDKIKLPKDSYSVRISVPWTGSIGVSEIPKTVITFDNNVVYDVPAGYSVNAMVKYKHNLYMTVNNNDTGWGKNITSPSGGSMILSSGVDNSGNLYSLRTDGSGVNNFYYYNTFTSRDGSLILLHSNGHVPAGVNLSINPWDNQLIWDSFNGKMLLTGSNGAMYSMTPPSSAGTLSGIITASDSNVNYNNYLKGNYPGFCVDSSGSVIIPNSYYTKTGTSIILGTLTKYSVSGTMYTPEWSTTPDGLNDTQGIIDSKIDDSYIIWDGNANIAKVNDDGTIKFQGTDSDISFSNDQGYNTMSSRLHPTEFTILPNGNILGVRVNYSGLVNGTGTVSQPTTLFASVIDKNTGKVLSNSSVVLIGDSSGATNRVLLANAGYVAVAGTAYSSVKIVVNKEDNSLKLTFWNNTIYAGDAGTSSDVRTGLVSLSASDTAIYAGTDSGLVLRYNLEDNFSYKWVSHSMTDITSKVLVTAQENYIYVTGGNANNHVSVIKMLPNGNLYESYVKAMKV